MLAELLIMFADCRRENHLKWKNWGVCLGVDGGVLSSLLHYSLMI